MKKASAFVRMAFATTADRELRSEKAEFRVFRAFRGLRTNNLS
jgi:hypothetical protein